MPDFRTAVCSKNDFLILAQKQEWVSVVYAQEYITWLTSGRTDHGKKVKFDCNSIYKVSTRYFSVNNKDWKELASDSVGKMLCLSDRLHLVYM